MKELSKLQCFLMRLILGKNKRYIFEDIVNFDHQVNGKMYDFRGLEGHMPIPAITIGSSEGPKGKDPEEDVTPKSVMNELERIPSPEELSDKALDLRIALFKRKLKLGIDNRYSVEQMKGVVDCLTRRKKYYADNKEFFEKYDYTSQEKIDDLLRKHSSLTMDKTTLFIPTFPEEAIQAMEQYTEKCLTLFKKKPIFYVIAKKEDFDTKSKKLDPILLVQSPFGFYWQILGAWDEEMLLLEEL